MISVNENGNRNGNTHKNENGNTENGNRTLTEILEQFNVINFSTQSQELTIIHIPKPEINNGKRLCQCP